MLMENERLLTAAELAVRWGLHRATVLRMFHARLIPGMVLRRGKGKARKGKATIRFRPSAIEAFEREHEQASLKAVYGE